MRQTFLAAAFRLAPLLALAACGGAIEDDHFANRAEPAAAPAGAASEPVRRVVPVRIGELGQNFDACSAAGTTRNLKAGQGLAVREGPFEAAGETARIAVGARFFVCSRSHDQKWFGVVFDESGALADRCGVAQPVDKRRAYDGPCRSGWVASVFVRTIAGVEQPAGGPVPTESAAAAPSGG